MTVLQYRVSKKTIEAHVLDKERYIKNVLASFFTVNIKLFYFINISVIQSFLPLRKIVFLHV